MNNTDVVVDQMVIQHTAFRKARESIEKCFDFSARKSGAEALAILGESRTGKTSVLASFRSKHPPYRDEAGLNLPILYATVPSAPTVKGLAGVMLATMDEPLRDSGSENEKTTRLKVLMKKTGTRMVILDEFQHFYDQGKQQIMYNVANWLKVLIDDTGSTLVVAGLPSCRAVINENEQLAGRFSAAVELPRFSWQDVQQRGEFTAILEGFHVEIAKTYQMPDLHSEAMAFRFFLATGGLIGYVSKILRQAIRNALREDRTCILLEDLNVAHRESIWASHLDSDIPRPFERGFKLAETIDLITRASRIGIAIEPQKPKRNKGSRKS